VHHLGFARTILLFMLRTVFYLSHTNENDKMLFLLLNAMQSKAKIRRYAVRSLKIKKVRGTQKGREFILVDAGYDTREHLPPRSLHNHK